MIFLNELPLAQQGFQLFLQPTALLPLVQRLQFQRRSFMTDPLGGEFPIDQIGALTALYRVSGVEECLYLCQQPGKQAGAIAAAG